MTFTVAASSPPPPSLSSLSQISVTAGGSGFTLTVSGSGFVNGSTVLWNGSALSTNYTSAGQLTASIPASLIATQGTASVTVANPGSAASNALTFTINAATLSLSGLSPSSATAGGQAFTLTINGSGFLTNSVVQWNGSALSTTYVSANQLSASVPGSLIAAQGTANITVINAGAVTSNSIPFVVTLATAAIQTISHIADGAGWKTSIILVNTDTVPASYAINFWQDTGTPGSGSTAYTPPLTLGTASGTIPVGGSTIIQTADADPTTTTEGWAQVSSSQSIGGTAIFRADTLGQEAAVPLLTTGGTRLEIPYQAGLTLGVALANPSATQTANITEKVFDQNGNQLSGNNFTLAPLSHIPQVLSNLTGNGVVEYDSTVTIYALGIRGNNGAFTSVDAVLPQSAALKTISHIADGAGWKTSIILVNTDTVPASYAINFWQDTGTPGSGSTAYTPPLTLGTASGTISVGGSTIIQTADADPTTITEGWAQVTSSQSIGGTAIFRADTLGQEAAVPLLTSGGTRLEIPYQAGLTLGVALANPSATQTANITEKVFDQNGNQLSSSAFALAPLSHIPQVLSNLTGNGVVEYDSTVTIYALGIRGNNGAFTSVRAVYK